MPGDTGRLNSASKQCNSRAVIVSELWVERWEKLFRIERQRAKVLQRVRERKKLRWLYICESIPKYLILLCLPAQTQVATTTSLWAQTSTHSWLSQDTSTAPQPHHCSALTHTVLTDICSIFQKINNFFTDYFHTFPPSSFLFHWDLLSKHLSGSSV